MAPSGVIPLDLITEPCRPTRLARLTLLIGLALTVTETTSSGRQFTSGVNVVEVYATVTDKAGKPVTGLGREAFSVRENGEPQQISTFAAGEFPLSVAVAIDRSFSMAGDRLALSKQAARTFIAALRPSDEVMVLAIGSEITTITPPVSAREAAATRWESIDAWGTTPLYDATAQALDAIAERSGRRALILISDGSDRDSHTTATDLIARARQSNVLVYPVAIGGTKPPVFAELANVTGGRTFFIDDPKRSLLLAGLHQTSGFGLECAGGEVHIGRFFAQCIVDLGSGHEVFARVLELAGLGPLRFRFRALGF